MPKPAAVPSGLADLVQRPGRSDARRNYDRLLAAASEMFATHGPDAALDEIARRAGVGNATLYRHFPTRRSLLVTVCVDEVEALCARGRELSGTCRPADALTEWLRAFVEHITSKRGLAAALMAASEGSAVIAACHSAIRTTGSALLADAQQAAAVRADVDIEDLLKLVNAIAMATETDGIEQADRLLALILDGIRT